MSEPSPTPGPRRPRAFRVASTVAAEAEASTDNPAVAEPQQGHRAPRAFRTDMPTGGPPSRAVIAEQPDPYGRDPEADQPAGEAAIERAQRSGMRGARLTWGGLFWSALGGLVSLGIGLWLDRLIEDLFARMPGLGWLGVALLATLLLAVAALAIREVAGVARQRRVATLHKALAEAHAKDDRTGARAGLQQLATLYATKPETARGRQAMAALAGEIVDGRDLIELGERHLMAPLDTLVRREIALAARRVSAVTAISPRAVIDLLFVAAQIVQLIRRIAEIYSGRPGLLGFLRLARSVGTHLAVTGGMAIGDSLLQQVVGHGIAAKLSARLGEGVLNGLLTTRVGLSAMAVCRPMPFTAARQPGVKDVAPFLFGRKGD